MSDEQADLRRRLGPNASETAAMLLGGAVIAMGAWAARDQVNQGVESFKETARKKGYELWQACMVASDGAMKMVHESFKSAAPTITFDKSVRRTVTGRLRRREDSENEDDDDSDVNDPPFEEKLQHNARRARHTGPEQVSQAAPQLPAARSPVGRSARRSTTPSIIEQHQIVEQHEDGDNATQPPSAAVVAVQAADTNEFESLASQPVRNLQHLVEQLCRIEAEAQVAGGQHAYFRGQFRSPKGVGRFLAKARITAIEKSIGEIVYNIEVAWQDGDQRHLKLRCNKNDFVKAVMKECSPSEADKPQSPGPQSRASPAVAQQTAESEQVASTEAAPKTSTSRAQATFEVLFQARRAAINEAPDELKDFTPADGADDWRVEWRPRSRATAGSLQGDVYFHKTSAPRRSVRSVKELKKVRLTRDEFNQPSSPCAH